jgi:hypothetical protein
MTFTRSDLPHLGWSLFGFLLALGTGGGAILYGNNIARQAERELQAAQKRLDTARSQLAAASADRENLRDYAAEYDALLERKIIGDERRLEWVEGMERIRNRGRLPEFSYAIAPQQPYTSAALPNNGSFEPGISRMSMQFGLLHEGQLITFLDALRNDVPGRFVLERCAVERDDARLRAECEGGWLTLKKRDTQ